MEKVTGRAAGVSGARRSSAGTAVEHERGGMTNGDRETHEAATAAVRGASGDGNAVVNVERVMSDTLDGVKAEWRSTKMDAVERHDAARGKVDVELDSVMEKLGALWLQKLSSRNQHDDAPFAVLASGQQDEHVHNALRLSGASLDRAETQRACVKVRSGSARACEEPPYRAERMISEKLALGQVVLQMDGLYDGGDDGYENHSGSGGDADGHPAGAGSASAPSARKTKREYIDDDSEPPLNSDDDMDGGSEDADDVLGEEPETDNLILAQYEKVMRKHDKWKVQLKDGIAILNKRDYLFSKAVCELEW